MVTRIRLAVVADMQAPLQHWPMKNFNIVQRCRTTQSSNFKRLETKNVFYAIRFQFSTTKKWYIDVFNKKKAENRKQFREKLF